MSENFESTYEDSLKKLQESIANAPTYSADHPSQAFWQEDGISLTGNPYYSSDTVAFTGSRVRGGFGEDHLTINPPSTFNLNMNGTKNHLWKYNEDKILKDVEEYVTSTYGSHYCGHNQDDIQTIDLMAAKDLAAHFCQANILKYGSRYGDKDGRNKRDLLKVIHYAMLLLHFDGHYTRKDNGLSEFLR